MSQQQVCSKHGAYLGEGCPTCAAEHGRGEHDIETIDVLSRRLAHDIERLRIVLERIGENARRPKINRKQTISLADRGGHLLAVMLGDIETPDLDLWRTKRAESEKAHRENQHTVTQKLLRAKELLHQAGWREDDLDAELKAAAQS